MVTRPPSLEEILAFYETFENTFPFSPTFTLFQGRFVSFDAEAGTINFDYTLSDRLLNPAGNIQGGIQTAAMDDAIGPLVVLMNAGRAAPTSTDIHTQYFRPAKPGTFRCTAKMMKNGKTICYLEAELFNDKGQLVSKSISTAALIRLGKEINSKEKLLA